MHRQLLLHAGLTAVALAIGLAVTAPDRRAGAAIELEDARWTALLEDLDAARSRLADFRRRLDAMPLRADAPPVPVDATALPPLAGIVPEPDAPAPVLERFAQRLVKLERDTRMRRLRAYYDMVTRPLLPGHDDATIERVKEQLATYARSMEAIPWGRLVVGDPSQEVWRQYLARRDADLREALGRDLTDEKVTLLMKRFAVAVPKPGEPLPSPRLAGGPRKGGR